MNQKVQHISKEEVMPAWRCLEVDILEKVTGNVKDHRECSWM